MAAGNSRLDVVRCLASVHGAKTEAVSAQGCTATIYAATDGHRVVVRCLASHYGAKIEATAAEGRTALIWRPPICTFTVCDILPAIAIPRSRQRMHKACEFGSKFEAMVAKGCIALIHAAYSGHLDVARCLASDRGAEATAAEGRRLRSLLLNLRGAKGCIALIMAAYSGHLDVDRCLASDCGAKATAAEGRTAVTHAAGSSRLDAV